MNASAPSLAMSLNNGKRERLAARRCATLRDIRADILHEGRNTVTVKVVTEKMERVFFPLYSGGNSRQHILNSYAANAS